MTIHQTNGARRRTMILSLLAAGLAGCGSGGSNAEQSAKNSATAPAANARGGLHVADNPACALLNTEEVTAVIPPGQALFDTDGTTTPGRFGKEAQNCFWMTNGDTPWEVAVNVEAVTGAEREAALASVRNDAQIGGTAVPGLGDVATTTRAAARFVAGERYVMVQVYADEANGKTTETATAQALDLARKAAGR